MIKRSLSIIIGAFTMTFLSASQLDQGAVQTADQSVVVEQLSATLKETGISAEAGQVVLESKEEKAAVPKSLARARSGSRTPSKDSKPARAKVREKIAESRSERSEGRSEADGLSAHGSVGSRDSSPDRVTSPKKPSLFSCFSGSSPRKTRSANSSRELAAVGTGNSNPSSPSNKLTEATLAAKEAADEAIAKAEEANTKE